MMNYCVNVFVVIAWVGIRAHLAPWTCIISCESMYAPYIDFSSFVHLLGNTAIVQVSLFVFRRSWQTQRSSWDQQCDGELSWPAVEAPREWWRNPSDLLHHRDATRLQVHMDQGWQCGWHHHQLHRARPAWGHRVLLPGHCCECGRSERTPAGQGHGETHQEDMWVMLRNTAFGNYCGWAVVEQVVAKTRHGLANIFSVHVSLLVNL